MLGTRYCILLKVRYIGLQYAIVFVGHCLLLQKMIPLFAVQPPGGHICYYIVKYMLVTVLVVFDTKMLLFERGRCLYNRCQGMFKGATTGSSTQHPIPKNHPSAMLVARQQCLSPLFPYSPYSHILFFFFFFTLACKTSLAFCVAKQFLLPWGRVSP